MPGLLSVAPREAGELLESRGGGFQVPSLAELSSTLEKNLFLWPYCSGLTLAGTDFHTRMIPEGWNPKDDFSEWVLGFLNWLLF